MIPLFHYLELVFQLICSSELKSGFCFSHVMKSLKVSSFQLGRWLNSASRAPALCVFLSHHPQCGTVILLVAVYFLHFICIPESTSSWKHGAVPVLTGMGGTSVHFACMCIQKKKKWEIGKFWKYWVWNACEKSNSYCLGGIWNTRSCYSAVT